MGLLLAGLSGVCWFSDAWTTLITGDKGRGCWRCVGNELGNTVRSDLRLLMASRTLLTISMISFIPLVSWLLPEHW